MRSSAYTPLAAVRSTLVSMSVARMRTGGVSVSNASQARSEERRVGKERRRLWWREDQVEGERHQEAARTDVLFLSSRRRHTRFSRDWSSDVCSSDLAALEVGAPALLGQAGDAVERIHAAGGGPQHVGVDVGGEDAHRRGERVECFAG